MPTEMDKGFIAEMVRLYPECQFECHWNPDHKLYSVEASPRGEQPYAIRHHIHESYQPSRRLRMGYGARLYRYIARRLH